MKDDLAAEFVESLQPTDYQMKLLSLIWSTESMTFFDLCNALRPYDMCPIKGDKAGWANLFRSLGELESRDLVECSKKNGKIDTLILTEYGANTVREFADSTRELFKQIKTVDEDTEKSEVKWDGSKYQFTSDKPF